MIVIYTGGTLRSLCLSLALRFVLPLPQTLRLTSLSSESLRLEKKGSNKALPFLSGFEFVC